MSLSKPRVSNKRPVKKYIKWEGADDKGFFSCYDKEANGGKGENIKIEIDHLIILDSDLFSITGYRNSDKAQFQSNEVRTINDTIEIKEWLNKKGKTYKKGTYKELKEHVKESNFLNYTKCIYGVLDGEVVHIQLKGSAAYQFSEIQGAGTPESHYISHTSTLSKKNGAVKFTVPVFSYGEKFSSEDYNNAIEIDSNILQPYLEAYLSGSEVSDGNDDHSQEVDDDHSQSFDIKNWRNYEVEQGVPLGSYKRQELIELQEQLQAQGDEGILMDCVGQALYDYQQADKTWGSMKDKDGRQITDYSLEELEVAYNKVPMNNPAKIKLELAIEASKKKEVEEGSDDWDDVEDIPF